MKTNWFLKIFLKERFPIFIIRGLNILLSFLVITFGLKVAKSVDYGIWITLSSYVTLIASLDFGINNTLRNELSILYHQKKINEIVKLIVENYYFSAVLGILVSFFSFCVYTFYSIGGINSFPNLKLISLVISFSLFLQVLFKPLVFILLANQKVFESFVPNTLSNLFLVVIFLYLSFLGLKISLFQIVLINLSIPVIITFFLTVFYLKRNGINIKDELVDRFKRNSKIKFNKTYFLVSYKFFIIQIVGVILVFINNWMILNRIKPEDVITYNLLSKYFSPITLFVTSLIIPLWTEFTNLYNSKNHLAIKEKINNNSLIILLILMVGSILILLNSYIFNIWLGSASFTPKINLIIVYYIFLIITSFGNLFTYFLNGTGNITLQYYLSIFVVIFHYFLLEYLMDKYNLLGVIYTQIIWGVFSLILAFSQYKIIIIKKYYGTIFYK